MNKKESFLIQIVMGARQVGKTTGVLQFLDSYKGKKYYCSADDSLGDKKSWLHHQWQIAQLKGNGTLLVIDEIVPVATHV